ncbi:MAG: hypothetical protein RL736_579 [Pseudomonadota bacterium]|jgi:single-strand DNA-binding protein
MIQSFNKVTLIGQLIKEPNFFSFPDGQHVCGLSIMTNESFFNKKTNETYATKDWFQILVRNQDLINYVKEHLKIDDHVFIEGELKTRKYTNQNGIETKVTEIVLKPYRGFIQRIQSDLPESLPQTDELKDDVPFF